MTAGPGSVGSGWEQGGPRLLRAKLGLPSMARSLPVQMMTLKGNHSNFLNTNTLPLDASQAVKSH